MAKTIPMLDLMFFLTEKKNDPKHVGALSFFKLPEKAGPRFVADMVADYRKAEPVAPFNQVPKFPLIGMPRWAKVAKCDMDYHVQHLALPAGAGDEALLGLVADLHAQVLDRDQPCFRIYFIEGLPDRTFAVFSKIHHSMIDGQSAIARLAACLDESPGTRKVRPIYAIAFDKGKRAAPARSSTLGIVKNIALKQGLAMKDLYANLLRKGLGRGKAGAGNVPFTAPRGPSTARTQASRSVATLSLPVADMKEVGKAFGGTINDVAVTILDAALLRYLEELGQSPAKPLVVMCPVSLREAGDKEAATKISALFVPLGKRDAAIGERMRQVMAAITSAKGELQAMSKDAAMLYAVFLFGISEIAGLTGANAVVRPVANFVLSNVAGPRTDLYARGAKMLGIFPISTLAAGMGLNVTLLSYSSSMDFGFVANGASMPHLDRLAAFTREAFEALKKEARKPRAAAKKRKALPARKAALRKGR